MWRHRESAALDGLPIPLLRLCVLPILATVTDEAFCAALDADALGNSLVVVRVQAKLGGTALTIGKAELVDLVTFLGVRLKKTANVRRFAADPPLAGRFDTHVALVRDNVRPLSGRGGARATLDRR
jgi:hypothetical protein